MIPTGVFRANKLPLVRFADRLDPMIPYGHECLQRLARVSNPCERAGIKAYSEDLRLRVLAACDRGMARKEVAETLDVSVWNVRRYATSRGGHCWHDERPKPMLPWSRTAAGLARVAGSLVLDQGRRAATVGQ